MWNSIKPTVINKLNTTAKKMRKVCEILLNAMYIKINLKCMFNKNQGIFWLQRVLKKIEGRKKKIWRYIMIKYIKRLQDISNLLFK